MSNPKVAVVTGAAEGLGSAIAVRLASAGHKIVLADLASSSKTAELVRAQGVEALEVECDVSSEEAVHALANAVNDFGGCDILVNNAGIYPFILFEDLTFADWRHVQATNLDSMFLTCKAFLPGMKARNWGRVVNMTSNAYLNGADPMLAAYVASKGGVIGLTRALGSEYGEFGITVNAVAPGLVVTDTTIRAIGGAPGDEGAAKWDVMRNLQAIKRSGTPEDIVGAVAFLTTDDARYMTAQTLVVDGGLGRV